MSSGVAAAVAPPAFDTMDTTPRAVFNDLDQVFVGILFQVLAIVRELDGVLFLNLFQRVGKGHFAEVMMVAITFAVGGDMNELVELASAGKSTHQAIGE